MGAILGELITLAPLFRGVEEIGHRPRDMYDRSQLEKIIRVVGVPYALFESKTCNENLHWPTCESHPFWKRATDAKVMDTKVTGYPKAIGQNSPECTLLKALCRYDPEKRLSAADALTHPYFHANPKPARNALDPGDAPAETYPQRKIKKDFAEKRKRDEREPGEVAPRGAAGAAALNAVRSYGDLRKH